MTVPGTGCEQRLRALAGVVSEDRSDIPARGLPMSLLRELKQQIPCDCISFEAFDSGRREVCFLQAVRSGPPVAQHRHVHRPRARRRLQ